MATTRLSDVIYGPLFLPTVIERILGGSILRQSGIAVPDSQVQRFANGPGDVVQMPYWNDLTGASNVSTDDPAQNATPDKLSQGQDMARKIRRNKGVQTANLVSSLLAQDPLDVAAQLFADYWVREEQRILISVLNGVFAAASMAGNLLPLASEDGAGEDAVLMDAEVSANAHALLGDAGVDLVAIAMHSRIFWNLVSAGAITFLQNPAGMTRQQLLNAVKFYQGKQVIVSDDCPRVAGGTSGYKYTSYLFGEGAIGYAEATGDGGPEIPVELDSSPAAGNGEGVRTVWHRRHWVMHPRGVAFTGTPAAASGVTDAELATGTNWTRKFDAKRIRIVAVTTNG
jgi:hypothetical protein